MRLDSRRSFLLTGGSLPYSLSYNSIHAFHCHVPSHHPTCSLFPPSLDPCLLLRLLLLLPPMPGPVWPPCQLPCILPSPAASLALIPLRLALHGRLSQIPLPQVQLQPCSSSLSPPPPLQCSSSRWAPGRPSHLPRSPACGLPEAGVEPVNLDIWLIKIRGARPRQIAAAHNQLPPACNVSITLPETRPWPGHDH